MSIAPEQRPTLKAAILAETDPAFVALRQANNEEGMAAWYRQSHPTIKAWDKAAPWRRVFNAIDPSKYTPPAANVNTANDATAAKQLLVAMVKLTVQQNMLLAFGQTIDARESGIVDAVLDSVIGIYTLSGTTTNAPGGNGGVLAAQQLVRPALQGELVFGGDDMTKATSVVGKILTWEGEITAQDISDALAS
jgi:hypothetical protein